MKIAVVGGGVSGLLAAYRLKQNNFEVTLFEESGYTGGRFEHAVKGLNPDFYPEFYKLIEELGLNNSLTSLDNIGVLTKNGIIDFKGFDEIVKHLTEKDQKFYEKMKKEALQEDFNPFEPSERLIELRKMSMREYAGNCSEKFIEKVINPLLSLTFMEPIDLERVSAEYGLFKLRLLHEFGKSNSQKFTKDEGIKVVTNVLERKAREEGVDFNLSSEVINLKFSGDSKLLIYRRAGKEKEESFDKVIFAIPLKRIEEINSGLSVGRGIFYNETKYVSLDGDLKTDKDIVFASDKEANSRMYFDVYHKEQQIFPFKLTEGIDFDRFYSDYTILEETEEKTPFPVLEPRAEVPDLKQAQGVYYCGDYYFYPYIENAIVTVNHILSEINEA